MPNRVYRGKAVVEGTTFSADVILYPIAQSMKLSHEFREKIVQDEHDNDLALVAANEMYNGDLGMVLIDKSSPSSQANARSGAAFLSPDAVVTISGCDVAHWNRAYLLKTGSDISQDYNAIGKMNYKLATYADNTQNALMTSTPS